jgi:hypothetical protein
LVQGAQPLLVTAILQSIAAGLYGIFKSDKGYAIYKGEENTGSNLVTREGLAASALSRV